MKAGVRILSVACAPLEGKRTLLFGIISRSGEIEGAISTKVAVDGTDSTGRLIKMLKGTRFAEQVRILALNGVGVAGLNILDIKKFEKSTCAKVISVTRKKPRPPELVKALTSFSSATGADTRERVRIVEEIGEMNRYRINGFFFQTGLARRDAEKFAVEVIRQVRLAHIIASGLGAGESSGAI